MHNEAEEILTIAEYAAKVGLKPETVRLKIKRKKELEAPWSARKKPDGAFEIFRRKMVFDTSELKDKQGNVAPKIIEDHKKSLQSALSWLERQERNIAEDACVSFLFQGLENGNRVFSMMSALVRSARWNAKSESITIKIDKSGCWWLTDCSDKETLFGYAPIPLRALVLRWKAHIGEKREGKSISWEEPPHSGNSLESIWGPTWQLISSICLQCGRETKQSPFCEGSCRDNYRKWIDRQASKSLQELDSHLAQRMINVAEQVMQTWHKMTEAFGNY